MVAISAQDGLYCLGKSVKYAGDKPLRVTVTNFNYSLRHSWINASTELSSLEDGYYNVLLGRLC